MNSLVIEAIAASKASRKNNMANYQKIKNQFWKIIRMIKRQEIVLTSVEIEKLEFHMKKMK